MRKRVGELPGTGMPPGRPAASQPARNRFAFGVLPIFSAIGIPLVSLYPVASVYRTLPLTANGMRPMFAFEPKPLDKKTNLQTLLTQPADDDKVTVFWLGQAGFALRARDLLVLVDPYLSDSLAVKYRGKLFTHQRMMPPPLAPDAAVGLNLLLSTHAHSDHFDSGTVPPLMAANPGCVFVCPKSAEEKATELRLPADRTLFVDAGEKHHFDAIAIEAIPSAHETQERNDRGEHRHLGYILELGGLRLYHSGDCVPYAGLDVALAKRRIDIALLPVNGRDDFRRSHGVPGNFTVDEAAKLCLNAGIGFLIPHHFGMFDFNTVSVDAISRRLNGCSVSGLSYWLPSTGACLSLESIERYDSRRFSRVK